MWEAKPTLSDAGVYHNSELTRRAFAAAAALPAYARYRAVNPEGIQPMIEPRDRDWGPNVDWTRECRISSPAFPHSLPISRRIGPTREVLVFDERSLAYGELETKSAAARPPFACRRDRQGKS